MRGRPQPEGRMVLVQFQCEGGRIQSILGSTFPRIGIELAKKEKKGTRCQLDRSGRLVLL